MKIDGKEQYQSFLRELTALEGDLNHVVGTLCEQLVDDYTQQREDIAARIKREESDGHKKSFCPTFLTHTHDKRKSSTHHLQWKRSRGKGSAKLSLAIKRGKNRDLSYPAAELEKFTPERFREMVMALEPQAAWVRRFNRVLVKLRETQRAIAALGDPPA